MKSKQIYAMMILMFLLLTSIILNLYLEGTIEQLSQQVQELEQSIQIEQTVHEDGQ